ncbi:hypothetical protein PENSPDRAFT_694552 [Peniophora sp. CONT]|nr:hypothetical protein PENSPDRAFT_694552 [Peniophora sp. CONT]
MATASNEVAQTGDRLVSLIKHTLDMFQRPTVAALGGILFSILEGTAAILDRFKDICYVVPSLVARLVLAFIEAIVGVVFRFDDLFRAAPTLATLLVVVSTVLVYQRVVAQGDQTRTNVRRTLPDDVSRLYNQLEARVGELEGRVTKLEQPVNGELVGRLEEMEGRIAHLHSFVLRR